MLVVAKKLIKSFFATLFFIIIFSIFKYVTTENFFALKNLFQILITGVFLGAICYRFLYK